MKPSRACVVESLEARRLCSFTPTDSFADGDTLMQSPETYSTYIRTGTDSFGTDPRLWIVRRDSSRFHESASTFASDPELRALFDSQGLGIRFYWYLEHKDAFVIGAPAVLSEDQLTAALSAVDGFQSVEADFVYEPIEPIRWEPGGTLIEFIPPIPDLYLASLSADTTTAAAGSVLTATFSYPSLFDPGTTYARVSFALSPDTTVGNADDIPLGGYMVPVYSSSLSWISTTLRLPDDLTPGSYHLVATIDADGEVTESDEANNTFVGPAIDITPAAPRDLTLANVSLGYNAPATYTPGSVIRPFAPAHIAGAFSRHVNIAYALSLDDIAGNDDDIPLGTAPGWADSTLHYSGEAIPMMATPSFTISASIAPGTYRVVAIVDPANQVTESDESNNAAVGPTITVQPPVAAPIPAEPTTPPAPLPPAVRAGSKAATMVTLSNPSAKHRKANHTVTLYLSPDATVNRDDLRFSRQTIAAPLKPGQSKPTSLTYKLPANAPLGTRYLIAVTDTGLTTATPITVTAPRLTAKVVSTTPAPQTGGLRVTVEVTNAGTARSTGPSVLRLFDADDHLLATVRRSFPLTAGASTTLTVTLRRSAAYSVTID